MEAVLEVEVPLVAGRFMKVKIVLITLLLFFSCKGNKTITQDFNGLPRNDSQVPITDFSNLFTPKESYSLSKKLIDYESSSTNQIAIITINSITPNYLDIQEFASEIGDFWGVGQKEKDNGLVIAICIPEKAVGISTGYGTEKILTDSICKNIIDYTMIPFFKKEKYFEGVDRALDSIFSKWN